MPGAATIDRAALVLRVLRDAGDLDTDSIGQIVARLSGADLKKDALLRVLRWLEREGDVCRTDPDAPRSSAVWTIPKARRHDL